MASPPLRPDPTVDVRSPARRVAFWVGVVCCVSGVLLHLPMYFGARDMHYQLNGMTPDAPMLAGMALIVVGLVVSFVGLLPAGRTREAAARIRVVALDDAPIRAQHVALLLVMAVAVTIDVMKPTSLAFVVPGFAKEYNLKAPGNPHGHTPAAWLPLFGITGTVLGSWLWGSLADRIGRRSAIVFAGLLFVTTSICGTMPGFVWNLLMCLLMGVAAGGMLPIAFTLLAETIPARHRGWLMVLIGGDIAGAYVITSWLAARLTPTYSWRILWLIGLPTGVLFLALIRWIPESPRFLLARGRGAEAEAVMARYGARVVPQDVGSAGDSASAAPDLVEPRLRGGYLALLRGRLLSPTVAVAVLGIGVGLVTYGFQLWVPTNLQHMGYSAVNSAYVVRNAALIGLPLTALMAWMYHAMGSRRSIAAVSAATALTMAVFAFAGDSLAHHRTWLAVLLIVPLSGASTVVAMVAGYAAEVYPTQVRARGTGLAAGMTKAGGILILAIVVGSKTVPGIAATAVLGAVPLLIAAVCFLLAPETGRRRLEDISRGLGLAPELVGGGEQPAG
jgi:putative MFS transporter